LLYQLNEAHLPLLSFSGGRVSQNEGKETLRLSHKDLNTSDNNSGLTESFSTSAGLCNIYTAI
jgi:hypothetical protein